MGFIGGSTQFNVLPLPENFFELLSGKPTIVLILMDCSTSMWKSRQDVVDYYNRYINELRELPDVFVALIEFNRFVKIVFTPRAVALAEEMKLEDFKVDGGTALCDVIAFSISALVRIEEDIKTARNNEAPNIILSIVSDGWERGSQVHSGPNGIVHVSRLISEHTKRGWTILYDGIGLSPGDVRGIGITLSIPEENSHSTVRCREDILKSATELVKRTTAIVARS